MSSWQLWNTLENVGNVLGHLEYLGVFEVLSIFFQLLSTATSYGFSSYAVVFLLACFCTYWHYNSNETVKLVLKLLVLLEKWTPMSLYFLDLQTWRGCMAISYVIMV